MIDKGIKLAVMGNPSYDFPTEFLYKQYEPSAFIINGYGGRDIKEWCNENKVPVIDFAPHYTPDGNNEEERNQALKLLVEEADYILIYADYIPSRYDRIYHPEAEPELTESDKFVIEYAKTVNKKVHIVKQEKIYKYEFMITEDDDDISAKGFTITVGSKDKNEESAQAEAIALAQLEFIKYINKWDSKYSFTLRIRRKRKFYERYEELNTSEIEKWFDRQLRKRYK